MNASYVPGSYYKRSHGSNMSRLNRQAVSSIVSNINSYGSSVFSTKQAQSEGLNEIIVKQVLARIQAEAQAKLKAATGSIGGNQLSGLGALTDTTA